MKRGTGRTTKQMQDAPKGAVFVWCNSNIAWPRDLARKIGREDIEIVRPSWLEGESFMGRRMSGVILDHATGPMLNHRQWIGLDRARHFVEPNPTADRRASQAEKESE